jgi:hypothetical protein
VIILVLLGMAWQVIANLLEKAEKRRRQQRQLEAAARQRGMIQPAGERQAPPVGPIPGGSSTRKAQDDLAARRRAQLDELRRRRDAGGLAAPRKAGEPTYQQAGSAVSPPPAVPARGRQISTLEGDMRGWHRQQESERSRHQEDLRQHAAAEKAALEEEARQLEQERARAARARQAAQRRATARDELAEAAGGLTAARGIGMPGASLRARSVFTELDRASLRRVFVFKELLDPPLALRQDEVTGMVAPEGQ